MAILAFSDKYNNCELEDTGTTFWNDLFNGNSLQALHFYHCKALRQGIVLFVLLQEIYGVYIAVHKKLLSWVVLFL